MKFRAYDILSHLIPGFIVYVAYLEFSGKEFNKDFVVPATAIAFVIGYFINTLASWLGDFYYWTWGGKPSNCLLDGKNTWNIPFYPHEEIRKLLLEECTNSDPDNDELFDIAKRYATPEVNSRAGLFNANFAFSRVLLTTILIVTGLFIYMYYDSYKVYVVMIPLTLISWYRSKQRGYYYAKEVLSTYLQQKRG